MGIGRTAILIDFADELEGTNEKVIAEITRVLRERSIEPSITVKEYDDEYGGPTLYFP